MTRLVSLLVVAAIIGMAAVAIVPGPVHAMTGSGTAEDPYMIYDVTDLQDMEDDLDAYYELANDIDASATSGWNGGAGFDPIGTWTDPGDTEFSGELDGNGYTISDLYINRSGTRYVGLFGALDGASVANLTIKDADITGSRDVGILAGIAYSDLEYVIIKEGEVVAVYGSNTNLGGLYGSGTSTVWRCAVDGTTVDGAGAYVGGFIGQAGGANIQECYSTGTLVPYSGYQRGGFIGWIYIAATIRNCYSRMSTGYGGLIGYNWYTSTVVDNCYSTGEVAVGGGGLIGKKEQGITCTDSFWDTQTSGTSTSAGGTGKTTAQMKTQSTFTDAGWDFDTIWGIGGCVNDGYPYLLWWYDPPDMIDDIYQVVWFQPNDIIVGTTLPNRAEEEDGIITWGANPAGIDMSLGDFVPEETYDFEPLIPSGSDIIEPEPETLTGDVDTSRLENNPLHPLVRILVSGSDGRLTDRLVWLAIGWFILIACMLIVHLGYASQQEGGEPQHFILTTLTGLSLAILFYVIGIFPLWPVILLAFGFIGSIVYERMPVL